jgi:hypothetical protein
MGTREVPRHSTAEIDSAAEWCVVMCPRGRGGRGSRPHAEASRLSILGWDVYTLGCWLTLCSRLVWLASFSRGGSILLGPCLTV